MSSPRRNRNNIQLTASAIPHGGRTLCEQLRVTGEDLCVALLPTHVRMSVNTESTNINTDPQLTASLASRLEAANLVSKYGFKVETVTMFGDASD